MMGAEMLIELGRRPKRTFPLAEAETLAGGIAEWLEPYTSVAIVAGSIRRRRPRVGDIEMMVLPDDWASFSEAVDINGWKGGDRIRRKVVADIPVEIHIAHDPKELGAMLMWYTGDNVFNVSMNSIAKRIGYTRNQYGIWHGDLPALQSPDEREFFDFLGAKWHDPEDRSFKDRPKRKKRATMGAEMLIELGGIKRKSGYIHLELISPEEDQTDNWVLRVERIDPFGGDPWKEDFPFEDQAEARRWFDGIVGDEDLDILIAQRAR